MTNMRILESWILVMIVKTVSWFMIEVQKVVLMVLMVGILSDVNIMPHGQLNRFEKKPKKISKNKVVIGRQLLVLIFFTAGIACSLQILYLTQEYLRYEVMEYVVRTESISTTPPTFSMCFPLLDIIDLNKIHSIKPDFKDFLQVLRDKYPKLAEASEWDLVHSAKEGRGYIYQNLTINELQQASVNFEDLLGFCEYLNSNLTRKNCDSSYFDLFAYNNDFCFAFKWTNSSSKHHPVYSNDEIRVPGFALEKIFDIHLNLTRLPSIGHVTLFAHHFEQDHLMDEMTMMTLELAERSQSQLVGLSYRKYSKTLLPHPYPSGCTRRKDLPSGNKSVEDCYYNCAVKNYSRITGKYPRFSIIREFDDKKLTHEYYGYSSNSSDHVHSLYRKCSRVCGTIDCYQEYFKYRVLFSPRMTGIKGRDLFCHFLAPVADEHRTIEMPRFALFQYFASLGSMMSIWFGFSISWVRKTLKESYLRKRIVPDWNWTDSQIRSELSYSSKKKQFRNVCFPKHYKMDYINNRIIAEQY